MSDNPIADAIANRIANKFDETKQSTSDLIKQEVRRGNIELDREEVQMMDFLSERVEALKASGADGTTVAAFQRKLDKYSH
jgi:anti-sigma28 factor (negative regulator of flagellin synthesis)